MSTCLQCSNEKIEARGLCNRCYVRMQYRIRTGKTTWKALMAMGKAARPFVRFEHPSSVIRQHPKEVTRLGPDKAAWNVCWNDVNGRRREKSCGPGADGFRAAEELKRRIEAGGYQPLRRRPKRDRSNRTRIPTPAGMTVISDVDRKRVFRDAANVEWCNALATGIPLTTLAECDWITITSTVVRITKTGRRAGREVIFLKSEIDDYKKSKADRAQGIYYASIDGKTVKPCTTRSAIRKARKVAYSTMERMEASAELMPIPLSNKNGYADANAQPVIDSWEKIWRKDKVGRRFSGIWPDGRYSITSAAKACTLPGYTLAWLVKKGIVSSEPRKPPYPFHGKEVATVLIPEVRQKKKQLQEVRKQVIEISTKLKLQANRRSQLFKALLAGKSVQDFVREWEAEQHNDRQAPPQDKQTVQTKYPGHAKKEYRTGRKGNPDREPVLEFCYDEYLVKGRPWDKVQEDARKRFGDRFSPKMTQDVKEFALQWANRFDPPLPTNRKTAQQKFGR